MARIRDLLHFFYCLWRNNLWPEFSEGWRRRNALMLDNIGCPLWLQRWRCPRPPQEWWILLTELVSAISPGWDEWDEEDDDDD